MKALLLYSPGVLRLTDVPDPVLGENQVLIKVERSGICGTDKAFYKGTYTPSKTPIILGHEVSGRVVDLGKNASIDKSIIGARVTTEINFYCGKCWYCRNGLPTHCPYRETLGISVDGSFAEYVVSRHDLIHVVNDLTPLQATFVEPLAAVVEMVELAPPQHNANIAVIGVGTIGLLTLGLLSRLYEPRLLVAVARPDTPKRNVASDMGAHEVLSGEELAEVVARNTPEGAGFDYVVEASGTPEGLQKAVEIVRPRGVVAVKSTHGIPTKIDVTKLVVKEASLVGSRCGPFKKAIKLLREGVIQVEKLVTSEFPLSRGIEAFEKSFERREIKVHIIA
ncbi:MAG: alcohol dehydrogenase catalytic domain-containing protein [Zestosphaera sp.]